jgi:hypothetical protein
MYGHGVNFEIQRLARREAGRDQIPDHFLLSVDHDGAARQLLQVDAVAAASKVKK